MRRILTILAAGLAGPCLYAQLSAQPETWAVLQGRTLAPADAGETLFLALEARAKITASNLANNPKVEARRLGEYAFEVLAKNDTLAAFRLMARLLALLHDKTPGEWLEVASSLRFQLDRTVCPAGAMAHATISPLFDPGYPLRGQYSLRVTVLDEKGMERKTLPPKPFESFEPREFTIPTSGLSEGAYRIRFDLLDKDGDSIAHALRSLFIHNTALARMRALQEQSEKIVLSGVTQKSLPHSAASKALEYITTLYQRASREQVEGFAQSLSPIATLLDSKQITSYSTPPIRPEQDLAYAESLAAQLLKGENPLATMRGPLRMAYRSSVDQSLQPYVLYLPPKYSAEKKWPLVVAIHPEAGDEGTYFERYLMPNGSGAMEHWASERGYVVITPNLRGPLGHLIEKGSSDIDEVVAEVGRTFSIDTGKIFLTGHMLGGASTLEISLNGKTQFAAFADVAGVPLRPLEYAKAPEIPLLFVVGGADTTVAPDEARRLGLLLEARYKKLEYVELEQEDHRSIANAAFPLMFNFFDKVRDGKWKPSGTPVPLPKLRRN
jgi:predicted esterase